MVLAASLRRFGGRVLERIRTDPRRKKKKRRARHFDALLPTLNHYCTHTTLHGLRYVVDPNLHTFERALWLVFFACFAIVACKVVYIFALQFQAAPTSTVIESTTYEVSRVPFPTVTLCPNNRVDWRKALGIEWRIFSNTTNAEDIKTFRDMLTKLSTMTFGDFDQLTFLKNRDTRKLAGVNITDLLREVSPSCQDLLSDCWWRNSNRNCCDIFEIHRTEYGYCYSFNSMVDDDFEKEMEADMKKKKGEGGTFAREASTFEDGEPRPRRVSGYGEWSGVKVTIHLGNVTKPPDSSEESEGVLLLINGPRVWPNSGTMIPVGASLSVSLDCISGYATQSVLELSESKMPCKYEQMKVYNQETCISLCRREHVIKYCGCNPSFLFPSNSQRDCNVDDFSCLSAYNDVFNDYYVLMDRSIVSSKKRAMLCDCPPECEYYIYDWQITSVPIQKLSNTNLDVHFATQTCFRYKTDIVFSQLDLLVSFGSIMGLFIGGSLLSALELIYYLMVFAYSCLRPWCEERKRRTRSKSGDSIVRVRPRKPRALVAASTIPTFPILDYYPVKPRSRRIPALPIYDPVKSNFGRY